MKTLLLILFPILTYSQAVVSYTSTELKQLYPEKRFEYQVLDDGFVWKTEFDCAEFTYFVRNGTDIIEFTAAFPNNMGCVHYYVEQFNNRYVIVSDNTWNAYTSSGVVLQITLIYDEENSYYYIIYKEKS